MKIAIFSDCYLDLSGGIVTNIDAEKSELERRGHTVYVFSSAYPHSAKNPHFIKLQQKLTKNHIFPVPSCKLWGRGITPIAHRPQIVERWILKHHPEIKDFDVFYIHYEAGCSIAGLKLGQKLHIPTVQVMHGREDVGEALIIPRGLRTIVAVALNWFHSWYLPHPIKIRRDNYLATTIARAEMWSLMVNHANAADLVIAPSEHFRQKLVHYGVSKPIVAVHHGIADEIINASASPKSLSSTQPLEIIWHSRLAPEKRILPFLEALSQVEGVYHLSAFGNGIESKQAQKYAKKHHLNVTFYGLTPIDQVQKAIKKAHLDVLVSYNYDTFGMTIIEAAATGVPVLIADPDLEEIALPGSYLLASSPAPADMAKAISSLIKNPAQIAKMSQAAFKNRDKLKLSAKITRLEQLFNAIIKS